MLVAIMCVRNEEVHLPSFINHLKKYVEGFVVLDDGSTDGTLNILENEAKILKIIKNPVTNELDWDEANNRQKVIMAAKEIGATWVLCCDPDERFEIRFLKKMKKLINNNKRVSYQICTRELWGDKSHYRVDGLWNDKGKTVLFPLNKEMDFKGYPRHHLPWEYRGLKKKPLKYNLYHFKMIRKEDREKRVKLYNDLDPDLKYQSIGYDYLSDEENLKLKKINFFNRYDFRNIPDYYK